MYKLPQLKAVGSSSTYTSGHKIATCDVRDFGLITDDLSRVYNYPRPSHWKDIEEVASENDICNIIQVLLKLVVMALCIDDIKLLSELGVFYLFPDLWILSVNNITIGFVEVKKKNVDLNDTHILGQVFDYLMILKNHFSLDYAFGILTNYDNWRVCWLPDADCIAAKDNCNESDGNATSIYHSSADIPLYAKVQESEKDNISEEEDNILEDPNLERKFNATRLCTSLHGNGKTLLQLIVSAIKKMYTFVHPIHGAKLISMSRKYTVLTPDTWIWVSSPFSTGAALDYSKMPHHKTKNFFILKPIGKGLNGKVWLACSKQLEACAIKIKQCKDPLKEKEEAEEEANKWTLLGYNRSRAVRLNGKYAIVMPIFVHVLRIIFYKASRKWQPVQFKTYRICFIVTKTYTYATLVPNWNWRL